MDFKVPEGVVGKDISNEIGLSLYDFKVSESQVSGLNVEKNNVYPLESGSLFTSLDFHFRNNQFKPGDTFTLKFSDDVDMVGVDLQEEKEFYLMDGLSKIALGRYTKADNSIHFTLTDYFDVATVDDVWLDFTNFINEEKYKASTNGETASTTYTLGDRVLQRPILVSDIEKAKEEQVESNIHFLFNPNKIAVCHL